MKISKDIRRLSHRLAQASFIDGVLDRDKVKAIMADVAAKKPRNYIRLLENYQRLLRLELEKRRARIESATELDAAASEQIVNDLQRRYGSGLTTEFAVNSALLGGVRIRVGNDVWDSSVRNRLDRLQQKL
ncbi:MAG TPA: F0F1 ATP synthase subunit delta [Chthoniobacterales bacterium]|jgi:F-type H+-transporting ATPase subunit delta